MLHMAIYVIILKYFTNLYFGSYPSQKTLYIGPSEYPILPL